MKRRVLPLLSALTILFLYSPAMSQQINNGLNYLTTSQNSDGSWGNGTTDTEILPATVQVMETLKTLNQTGDPSYVNAVLWLQNQSLDTTDYLSERIYALLAAGSDKDMLLWYLDELVIAWGGYDEYGVNNLDTALVLLAFKRINYSDQNIISTALGFLLSTQNLDGGWGFYPSACSNCEADPSNVYMTAMVLKTLSQYRTIYNLETAINNGVSYLLTKQNPDGGFGSSPSTVYETALAFLAMVESGFDISSVAPQAINYLTSTQLPNGSWNDDPYSTALALRALANVKPNLSV
jgi:squalene cyclase